MADIFGNDYASIYDQTYSSKSYSEECDAIEGIFAAYGRTPTSILDLGCGTGGHSLELADRGYSVLGIDSSEPMIASAIEKALTRQLKAEFVLGDIQTFHTTEKFECALMMFAVLGYQCSNHEILTTLRNVRSNMKGGSLLVFDVWYGPAVLHKQPENRFRVMNLDDRTILRAVSSTLDALTHTCVVSYRLWSIFGDKPASHTEEQHTMRFFFPLELDLLLSETGFRLLSIGAFPTHKTPPTVDDWNVLVIAEAEPLSPR